MTIAGAPFPHLLYHFWLAFSRLAVRQGDPGRRELHRADRGPAGSAVATRRRCPRRIAPTGCRRPTAIWRQRGRRGGRLPGVLRPLRHASRPATMPASAMRTASVEAAHGHLKTACARRWSCAAPRLRRRRRLPGIPRRVRAAARTRAGAPRWQLELPAMRPLPRFRTTDFSLATVTVTRSGTISRARRALHRALAAGRLPAQGARLRRPAASASSAPPRC